MENKLTISEKLMLLAIRSGKGGISFMASHSIDFITLGALLLELSLAGNLKIRDKRIEVVSVKTGSELGRYMLEKLSKSSRPRTIGHWLSSFSLSKKKIRAWIYQSLMDKREIRLEDRRFLFFHWKKPYLHPASHVTWVASEVKNLVMEGSDKAEDIFLLILAEAGELLYRIYPERQDRKSARLRIKRFQSGNAGSEAVRLAIDMARAIRTAVAASHAAHVAHG